MELQVRVELPVPGLILVGFSVQVSPDGVETVRLIEPVNPLRALAVI